MHQFAQLFSAASLEAFWTQVLEKGDDRLRNHPFKKGKDWMRKGFPLFLHGDAVEYQSRDSLMVWSWGPLLNLYGSLDSHFLISCFPKSCSCPGTWGPVMKWLVWSLTALQEGIHPTKDPDGLPLKKGTIFHKLQGQMLTPQGYRGVIWSTQADHEFFSNVLHLPHWGNPMPCWECDATNRAGAKPFDVIHPEKRTFVKRSLEDEGVCPHEIFQVPGLSTRMMRGDGLHIVFTKGVFARFLGGLLHYCCWYTDPGTHQKKTPKERLALIFSQIQKAYGSLGEKGTRLTNLKLSMFSNTKSPFAHEAFLSCKGAETKHLVPALLAVCRKILGKGDKEAEGHMLEALEKGHQLVALWDAAGIFLTPEEHAKCMHLCDEFCRHYDYLNKWSLEKERNSFYITNKHHTLIHLCENSKWLNPRFHWCFKSHLACFGVFWWPGG